MNSKDPYISIIIPAYNAEKNLENCVKSIVEQSYKSYEIIIINDGSKDSTKDVCFRLKQQYQNIKIVDSENLGVSAARNLGIEAACGEWICFIDSDDKMLGDSLKQLVTGTCQPEINWVIGNFISLNEASGERILNKQYFEEKEHIGIPVELPEFCASRNFHCVWGKLYTRSIIETYKIRFDEKLQYGEDLLFNLEYFQHIDRFIVLNTPVYLYVYQWGTGLGCSTQKDEWLLQKQICERIEHELACNEHMNKETLKRMNRFYFSQCIASLERTIIEKNKTGRRKIVTDSFFCNVLQIEKEEQRIHKIDYFLLKNKQACLYYYLHRCYVQFKKYKEKLR